MKHEIILNTLASNDDEVSATLSLWGNMRYGLARIFDGDSRWYLQDFIDDPYYLDKLDNGNVALGTINGLLLSSDDAASWSSPINLNLNGTNDVLIHDIFTLPDGRLYLSGTDRKDCKGRPHLISSDGGYTWSVHSDIPTIVGTVAGSDANLTYNRVQVQSVDKDGVMFGNARYIAYDSSSNKTQCTIRGFVPVRSDDTGATWQIKQGIIVADQANSQNSLINYNLELDRITGIRVWRQGASS